MTYKSAISTTIEKMIPTVRDEISTMTGWTVHHEGTRNNANRDGPQNGKTQKGDFVVFQTPNGEFIEWRHPDGNPQYGWEIRYGAAYDTTQPGFTDRYAQDPTSVFSSNNRIRVQTTASDPKLGDEVDYWITYEQGFGFGVYVYNKSQKNPMWIVFGRANPIWDYQNAARREGDYVFTMGGVKHEKNDYDTRGFSSHAICTPETGNVEDISNIGIVAINGDPNFNNAPAQTEGVVSSGQYGGTPYATTDLWVKAQNGADGAEVDDSNGNPAYEIIAKDITHQNNNNPKPALPLAFRAK